MGWAVLVRARVRTGKEGKRLLVGESVDLGLSPGQERAPNGAALDGAHFPHPAQGLGPITAQHV